MARLCPFFMLWFVVATYGNSFPNVERKVSEYPKFRSVTDLGYRIMNDFDSDSLRVRAAFLWVARNMKYGKGNDSLFISPHLFRYTSEEEKELQIDKLVEAKLDVSMRTKVGVCVDYSLLLNALCKQFGLPSKVILGTVKTKLPDKITTILPKNHTWNAVRVNGSWRLMDATWASGHSGLEEKKFTGLYFFSDPKELIKSHFPMNKEWQLLASPVNAETFCKGPVYYKSFFTKEIVLSERTEGTFSYTNKEMNRIYFDKLPSNRTLYFAIGNSKEFKKLGLKKEGNTGYSATVRIPNKRMVTGDTVTLYKDDDPIAYFKIKD